MYSEHLKKKSWFISYKTKEHRAKRLSEAVIKSTKNAEIKSFTGSFH